MNEQYQKVAYIGLRKKDGSYAVNIPLYVKLDEVNKKDMDESREEIIHKVTEIMMRRYEKQLAEIMNSKRPPPTERKEYFRSIVFRRFNKKYPCICARKGGIYVLSAMQNIQ